MCQTAGGYDENKPRGGLRVIGEIRDAAPYKSTIRPNSPKDVRGPILLAVEELQILGDQPGQVKP